MPTLSETVELAERHHAELARMLPEMPERTVRAHLWAAPHPYLAEHDLATIARHLSMAEPKPVAFETRLHAEPLTGHERWRVHIAMLDRRGVLATIAGTFARHRISVSSAAVSTWRNGLAVDVFDVHAPVPTEWDRIARAIELSVEHGDGTMLGSSSVEGVVSVDNEASPWYSVVEVRARDRSGLLHRVASALSAAGVNIHQANIATHGTMASDMFWVTTARGTKLSAADERRLHEAFAGRPVARRRRLFGRRGKPRARARRESR
jgi:[protein-PII] uridylyltransferase